jgi:hypothetical protein
MLLPDRIGKAFRSPFTGKYEITHGNVRLGKAAALNRSV